MKFDFDKGVNRTGTNSEKWDYTRLFTGYEDLLPMWVADMDFESPLAVKEALIKRAKHGVFGYTMMPDSYFNSVINWMKRRHNWDIKREWIVHAPGVVPAINFAIHAFSDPGDKVIVQPPVYYPFFWALENNRRERIDNLLTEKNGRYTIDFDHLENCIDKKTKLIILCSPHNPVARVWTREELARLAEICLTNNIIIVSDEIHADLVFSPHKHTVTAALSEEIADITVTCTAPNKTFNIAGLNMANVISSNQDLRKRFVAAVKASGIDLANLFGIVATEAAYNHGEEWLVQLLHYIRVNFEFMKQFLADNLPDVKVSDLEGTYLAWLDFRAYGKSDKEMRKLLREEGKLWLDDGSMFGPSGEGFQRINIACPRSILEDGLKRMVKALREL